MPSTYAYLKQASWFIPDQLVGNVSALCWVFTIPFDICVILPVPASCVRICSGGRGVSDTSCGDDS